MDKRSALHQPTPAIASDTMTQALCQTGNAAGITRKPGRTSQKRMRRINRTQLTAAATLGTDAHRQT